MKSIGFIALYVLINAIVLIGYIIISGTEEIEAISANAVTATLIVTQVIVLLLILLMYKKRFTSVVRFKKISPIILFWSFIIGLAAVNISVLLLGVMDVLFPQQMADYIEAIEGSIGGANILLSFTAAVLLAPLVEEIAMRGMLFRWFEKTAIKPWLLVVLSGLFFGLFHLNLIQGVFTSVIGMVYGLGFLMTKSLWVPIVMHFVNNLYAVTAGYLPEALLESQWYTIISYVMIVLVPIGLYQIKKELSNPSSVEDIHI